MLNGLTLPCEIVVPDIKAISYQEWLTVRRSGIGGSDAAAAVGISPWKSQLELWDEKANDVVQPRKESESMLWGRTLEPIITDEFCRRTGMAVQPMNAMLQHPCHPFMRADLDGIVDKENTSGVFEVKTASAYSQDEWKDGRVPDHYMLQLQHYMAVSGLQFAVICVLIGGNTMRWTTVPADYDLIADLIKLETAFWRHVLDKTPPPVDGSSACSEMLARKYPKSTNTAPLILPSEADIWIKDWRSAKADEAAAEERKRLAENKLKDVIGDHERSVSPAGVTVSWKNVESSRIDTVRLKADEPSVWERFLTTTSSRRLTISDTK